jgi:hypothetical protein
MRRFLVITAASAGILLAAPFAAQAARPGLVPAPPSSATATALSVADVVDVSTTGAQATPDTSSAQASVVEVGGEPLLGLGGSQTGPGSSDGALLDTGSSLPARAQVAPWKASAANSSTQRSSTGEAAAARADVPATLHVDVLESESQATHTDEKSTGAGSSNGVDLGLLDFLRIVLFHSEVSSEGKGSSFLIGANEMEIGSDEQLGAICSLAAHPLLSVTCLDASGGVAGGVSELARAETSLAPPLHLASAFSVDTSGGAGGSPLVASPVADLAPATSSTDAARVLGETLEAPASGGGMLPRTGAAVALPALLAALAAALGVVLRRAGRRGAVLA